MAELNIKKKRRFPVLWALLGILAVAMIVWFFTTDNDEGLNENNEEMYTESETWGDDSDAGNRDETVAASAGDFSSVNEFISFADETMSVDMNHEATHRGLTQLAAALGVLTSGNENELEQIREEANQLLDNRMSDQHANIMRDAFVSVATIIQNQDQKQDDNQVTPEVMEAAKAVDPKEPATDQKAEIKNFFDTAADALAQLQTSETPGNEINN